MSDQFGNTSNASTVDKYACPECGANPGTPCLVIDSKGVEMVRSLGVMHVDRIPDTPGGNSQ
jgi:hypothetical protein